MALDTRAGVAVALNIGQLHVQCHDIVYDVVQYVQCHDIDNVLAIAIQYCELVELILDLVHDIVP